MLSSPPQGFTATAVLPSAVDGTTIASTGGVLSAPALVNLGSGVFSAYPIVLGTDTGESIAQLTLTSGQLIGPSAADLHVYAQGDEHLWLNYYGGTGGVYFGDGDSGSSGTFVSSAGDVTVGGSTGITFSTNNASLISSTGAKIEAAGAWNVYPAGTGNRALNVWGLTSQGADIFAVLNEGGTELFGVAADGKVYTPNAVLDDGSGNLSVVRAYVEAGGSMGVNGSGTLYIDGSDLQMLGGGLHLGSSYVLAGAAGTLKLDGVLTSTLATGTAPLSVASTTQVANLNAQLWGGAKNDIALIAATGGYTTTSSTHVSTGQGGSFTPSSGKVEIVSSADVYNETAGEVAQVGIYRNTSGVPSSGTSVGSDTLVASASMVSGTASADATVSLVALDTGLTAGTTYYYYWAIWVESSGTVGLQTLQGESLQTTRMLLRST